jgi:hypothetical protein
MALLRVGRDRTAELIAGLSTCHWGTSGASIWVSSSTELHTAASTWFTTGTPVATTGESGYPQAGATPNIFEHRGVFSTDQANFQWESWLINTATASDAGVALNMAVNQVLGTKANTQSWQITTCVTLTT